MWEDLATTQGATLSRCLLSESDPAPSNHNLKRSRAGMLAAAALAVAR